MIRALPDAQIQARKKVAARLRLDLASIRQTFPRRKAIDPIAQMTRMAESR